MKDEIFGPILPVLTYRQLDEVIEFVSDSTASARALFVHRNEGGGADRDETSHVRRGLCQ